MIIIPAIDIIDGKCVRLTQGDYSRKTVYNESPVEVAKQFEDAGIKRIHVVDLDGAKSGAMVNIRTLEKISGQTSLTIDFGGGIKKRNDVQDVFNAGAAIVTVGSIAVKHPELLEEWLPEFGADKFLIGADVWNEKIKIGGWLEDAGIIVFDFIRNMTRLGAVNIFCTDISRDGALKGPSVDLYKKIIHKHPEIQLTASGGITTIHDIVTLKNAGCMGAIIGKALYEGTINLHQLTSTINHQP